MSVVRKFRPKLRLTALMAKPGGLRVREALRNADSTLAGLRDSSLCGIDELLRLLDEEVARSKGRNVQPDLETIYGLSTRIIDLCGALDGGDLDHVARSLCDYVDAALEDGHTDLRAIQVHLASMRLLHRTTAGPEARGEILEGLARVLEHQHRG